jgi:hypothetical protein
MSDIADYPVLARTPVSAEARGLARDFCRRVGREAALINEQAIGAPLRRRILRHPDRRPRDALLVDLERSWRKTEPQQFRLAFCCDWQGRDVSLNERAVTTLRAFRLDHWDSNDYGVEVIDTWFEVRRGRAQAGLRSCMVIGSHALGRWFERSGSKSHAHLLKHIAIGAAVDASDRVAFPDLDDVRVAVNATTGWRGAIMLAPEDEDDALVFYARTFV